MRFGANFELNIIVDIGWLALDIGWETLAKEICHYVRTLNCEKEFVYVGIHSRRTDHLEFQTNKGNVLLKPSYYLGKINFFTIQSCNIKADFLS